MTTMQLRSCNIHCRHLLQSRQTVVSKRLFCCRK